MVLKKFHSKKARSRLASSIALRDDDPPPPSPPSGELRLLDEVRARGPPSDENRLLSKHEVTRLVGRSYQHIWSLMRRGKFPRSRLLGSRPVWVKAEIDAWIASLPIVHLKGDAR